MGTLVSGGGRGGGPGGHPAWLNAKSAADMMMSVAAVAAGAWAHRRSPKDGYSCRPTHRRSLGTRIPAMVVRPAAPSPICGRARCRAVLRARPGQDLRRAGTGSVMAGVDGGLSTTVVFFLVFFCLFFWGGGGNREPCCQMPRGRVPDDEAAI